MATEEAWTLHKRVDEVTVFFTVRKAHKYVDDVTQEQIRVRDDGKPAVWISSLGHQSDLPLRLGLLIDTSGSVQSRRAWPTGQAGRCSHPILPRMVRAFASVEQEMRSRYALAYQPSDLVDDRRCRRIEIYCGTVPYKVPRAGPQGVLRSAGEV